MKKYFNRLKKEKISHVSLNIGLLCNQACKHCHLEADQFRKEKMDNSVIGKVINFLQTYLPDTLEITGGAPELNENLTSLIEKIRPLVSKITLRTNLTALYSYNNSCLIEFLFNNEIGLVASLPCFTERNVTLQRGKGVFEKSISVLKTLNEIGYGVKNKLPLILVYNPLDDTLPPEQKSLELKYREELKKTYGIEFTSLIAMANVPVGRFKKNLEKANKYDAYLNMLKRNFNQDNLSKLMCLNQVTIGWSGRLYDCDFNLALDYPKGGLSNLFSSELGEIEGKKIFTGSHCLTCTAISGSSCHGSLQ